MSKPKLEDIVVVTSNKNKLKEINEILGTNHKVSEIDIPEIQSMDLDEIITAKATAAYEILKKPVLVTDVSLQIEALDGLPGPFVKYFLHTLGAEKTVKLIKGKNKKAKSTDVLGLYDGKNIKIFKGSIEGVLIEKGRGKAGFGFDVVFVPKGSSKTYAEMSLEEKNQVSHRAKALKALKKYFNSQK